jgi:hypothetical protein
MITVYQRCLSNYQEMTWDQGSFIMFNKTLQASLRLDMPQDIPDTFNVATCLLEQKGNGSDNVGCLTDYFLKGTQAIDYFEYGNITGSTDSKTIDACLTFSGPANHPDPVIAKPFVACLETYANRTGCDIPHMLWSGRSTNKVPVATQHTLKITDPATRQRWAEGERNATQARVLQVLDKLEKEWTGDGLKISIFSSEGTRLI